MLSHDKKWYTEILNYYINYTDSDTRTKEQFESHYNMVINTIKFFFITC